jgi:hypothetical protein
MGWKNYWTKVVARYEVKIEGWPENIPFQNLSVASSPLQDLVILLKRWQEGTTYWKRLTSAETKELIAGMKARGEIQEPLRRTRSDRGKKRKRQASPSASGTEDRDGSDLGSADVQPSLNKRRKRRVVVSAGIFDSDGSDYLDGE